MTTELITEAFRVEYLYSFWWLLLPVVVGLGFFWGFSRMDDAKHVEFAIGFGIFVALGGVAILWAVNMGFKDTVDEQQLTSDISSQLQIQELDLETTHVYSPNHWYVGKGSDGKFVKFALLEDGDTDNSYVVVYK